MATTASPDLILHRGVITTLDRSNPAANAVAIKDGKFVAVGSDVGLLGRGADALAKKFRS